MFLKAASPAAKSEVMAFNSATQIWIGVQHLLLNLESDDNVIRVCVSGKKIADNKPQAADGDSLRGGG